jgi:hypothetical protein
LARAGPTAVWFADDAEIEQIGEGLLDRTLPKARWTHAGHFAAATWILLRRPQLDPFSQMPGLIRAYNLATGVANTDSEGYHETITQASLRAAKAFLGGLPADTPLHQAVNALLDSPLGRRDWLLEYWSRDALFSVAARRGWLEPDLRPLLF